MSKVITPSNNVRNMPNINNLREFLSPFSGFLSDFLTFLGKRLESSKSAFRVEVVENQQLIMFLELRHGWHIGCFPMTGASATKNTKTR
jgi:hypothetical protein